MSINIFFKNIDADMQPCTFGMHALDWLFSVELSNIFATKLNLDLDYSSKHIYQQDKNNALMHMLPLSTKMYFAIFIINAIFVPHH